MDPTEVSPDGLYQQDIVLTKDQAYDLFSKYYFKNNGRKVIRKSVYRWPSPIIYFNLDANYSKINFYPIKFINFCQKVLLSC
jgi:hypothetical protein